LPPIQKSCEFDSLDTAGDSEAEKKPIEVGFNGPASHLELASDLIIVAALE
jgi:hypothetical protein